VSVLALSGPLAAQTRASASEQPAFPTSRDLIGLTVSGSYLAARHASVERDATAAAAFYRAALRSDPKNSELLDRAFIASLADGNIDEAVKLADRILTIDKNNRVARLVAGVRSLKHKQYALAQQNVNQSVRGPITDLVAVLVSGWASYGAGHPQAAVSSIDKLAGPEWYPIFKDLHTGMILELANKQKEAGARFERAYKLDDSALRVSDAYARWLSRNKDAAAATAVYEAFDKKLARHPLVVEGLREAKAGKKLPPLAENPQQGAAEALYGIGASLSAGYWGDDGSFAIQATYAPDKRDRIIAVIQEEIARMDRDGITAAELARAKKDIAEARRQGRADTGTLVGILGNLADYGETWLASQKRDETLAAVTVEQANAAWRRYIRAEGFIISTAGDFKTP